MTMIDATVSVSMVQDVCVVSVSGELDDFQAPQLHSAFETQGDIKGRRMIIDLTGVTFVDSVGLGVIVAQAKRAKKAGFPLALVASTPQITRLIAQSGIVQSKHLDLKIYDNLDVGISSFSS
ncbi:anti-sigma factor antagonist [bacterium]|nr:anti-sigma factor antagonist [bacterium]